MRLQSAWARGLFVAGLAVTTACYAQHPLETTVPAPATRVIVDLTDNGTVAMSNLIGPGAVEVEGVVTNANSDAWTLQLVRVEHRDMRSIDWNREPVTFPTVALRDPRVRTLDRKKSWLVGIGIVGGAYVLSRTFNLIGSDEVKDDQPVPEFLVIPGRGR